MAKKLTVIFGAGASRDLIGNQTAIVQPEYTPPLAGDLFTAPGPGEADFAKHGSTAQYILEEYPRAAAAAATLGLRGDQSLEEAMKTMQASTEVHTRRQFVQVPLYLRHLFWEISGNYTSQPVNYINMLNAILGSGFQTVGLVTTNYDTFLEEALKRVVDATFTTLDSYVDDPKWALVKLHGSVNWARYIKGSKTPDGRNEYLQFLDEITMSDPDGVTGRLETTLVPLRQKDLWNERGAFYPALVAPIDGKYEYACPPSHIDRLRAVVKACENVLVIGSSGRDADLTDLLGEEIGTVLTLGIVATGDGNKVLERYRQAVPAFRDVPLTRVGVRGFSHFISSGDLALFLQQLYDDDDREPWLDARKNA